MNCDKNVSTEHIYNDC